MTSLIAPKKKRNPKLKDFDLKTLKKYETEKSLEHDETALKQYKFVAKTTASSVFAKNQSAFKSMGVELEDLQSIAWVFVNNYISQHSIRFNKEKQAEFDQKERNQSLKSNAVDKIDTTMMIRYVNQRLVFYYESCVKRTQNEVLSFEFDTFEVVSPELVFLNDSGNEIAPFFNKSLYKKIPKAQATKMGINSSGRHRVGNKTYVTVSKKHLSNLQKETYLGETGSFQESVEDSILNPENLLGQKMDRAWSIYQKANKKQKEKLLVRAVRTLESKSGSFRPELKIAKKLLREII